MNDAELGAMKTVYDALEPLDDAAQQRTLNWVAERLELKPLAPSAESGTPGRTDKGAYADVPDLVNAAQPDKGPDYAMVVAYWLQVVEGKEGWSGNEVNSTLRNLGHGIANITTTFDRLIKRKPSLVMQTGKSGRSQQAKKTYKLTTAGIGEVDRMLARVADDRGEAI